MAFDGYNQNGLSLMSDKWGEIGQRLDSNIKEGESFA